MSSVRCVQTGLGREMSGRWRAAVRAVGTVGAGDGRVALTTWLSGLRAGVPPGSPEGRGWWQRGFAGAVRLGVWLSGMGRAAGWQTQFPQGRWQGRSFRQERGWAGLTLAASDSCASSSTDSARHDRLSKEPSRRRPPHRVAIAGGPAVPQPGAPATGSRFGLGLRLRLRLGTRLGILRPHFRLDAKASPGAPGQMQKAAAPETVPSAKGREAGISWFPPWPPPGPREGGLWGGNLGPVGLCSSWISSPGAEAAGLTESPLRWKVLPPTETPANSKCHTGPFGGLCGPELFAQRQGGC